MEKLHSRLLLWGVVLAAYGVAFVALRSWASVWSTLDHFSLWFPAAGLRFALLWFVGPRMAPYAAAAELVASLAWGTATLGPNPLFGFAGIVTPCLLYGLAIHLVRRRFQIDDPAGDFNPLPFAAAVVVAPVLATLGGLTTALPGTGLLSGQAIETLFANLLVFALGDLLGILLLAPPLLSLAERLLHGRPLPFRAVRASQWLEMLLVLGLGWAVSWFLYRLQFGTLLAPVLVATCWSAIRSGRLVAWVAILISTIIILPISVSLAESEDQQVQAHLLLACIAAGGYLVGSYADAQARAAKEIRRRDRLLFQAERLKTLRAMSLGVIHEVSQPLATIALEAENLTQATSGEAFDKDDVRDMAARIGRKTTHLSDLVRRLRRFGESGSEERSLVSPQTILNDIVALVRADAAHAGARLQVTQAPESPILVSDVEVRQALLNLVRNAIQASPSGHPTVWLSCFREGSDIAFAVENSFEGTGPNASGMRIGLFIARAIARVHGGSIRFDHPRPQRIRCTMRLPAAVHGAQS